MLLRTILRNLVKVVSDEAERNPEFAEQLWDVLISAKSKGCPKRDRIVKESGLRGKRPANRRPPAVLDPIKLAEQGEEALRTRLSLLTLDQLKDIVADYGMDQKRLVMRWKRPDRVIDKIVEVSVSRARKGDAFRL